MAKKKNKAAKKAAKKKKASGAAAVRAQEDSEAGSCSDQELEAAGVVTAAGELAAGFATAFFREIEARGIDPVELVKTAAARLQRSSARERASGEENADAGIDIARRLLQRHDFKDKPYLRVFGRVMEILLNHREFQTCTTGDVFRVFLLEISSELQEHHRQNPRPGMDVSASTGDGRKTFNNRMKRMCREDLARPTVKRQSGREEGYVLTEDGQNMFDGWPLLSEIPGLEYDGPVKPKGR